MPATPQALILKASAGSGKTFALAKEFIKLLILDPTEYHQILALTFTNDAKNEMKTRVLGELTKLASGEQTDMLQTILADFAEQKVGLTQDQVVLRSRLALNNLLNDYSRFNVNTLDHFFTQLIRHLARELKLNLGYELDLDNDKALRESIHTLYKTTNPRVKKWLRSFIDSRISEDKGWNIEFNIKTLGKKLFQDSFIDIRDILNKNAEHLEGFVKQLNIQFKSYEASMQKLGQQAMQLLASHKLTISDFRQHTATVFQKLSEGTFDLEASFSATFIKGEWSTKTSDRKDEIETCATSGLNELHSQILELAESEQKQAYIEAKALLPNIYSYGVLSALSDNLWEYRTNNNLLLLSDTAFILHGVISQSDAPFIYEKIGARYKHIMIDEFQDTSTHQWKNILPLVQFSLFNEGSVMLVGDVKQSVYRWRGGDANLLMQQAAADLSEHTPAQKALDTNYRSAKNIVAFNNAFFEAVRHAAPELIEGIDGKSEQLAKAYEDVHQRTQKSFEGYVKVEFFSDEEETGWKEKAFNVTHATIKKAMEDGFHPEDIMVLVRTNKQAGEIAEFLLRNGIHTLTDEALYLEKSPLVQFLVFALRSILAPEDAFVLANLRYFHQLILGQSPSKAVSEKSSSTDVSGISAGLSAYEAIEQLIEQFGLHKKFDPFLQGLQDFCLKQAKKGNSSIASFVEGWQEVNEEENTKPSFITGRRSRRGSCFWSLSLPK
ncbi:MAG: UvrD-helicase domain-containing protein, partial [Cyclobacteriaceae bacterium]|nr:UvrD-helicase domain-containing protein [Cyclobacteriaceae bacterium]